MAEYGKFHAANYWLLGGRILFGIEIAACGEGNAVIGLEGGRDVNPGDKMASGIGQVV